MRHRLLFALSIFASALSLALLNACSSNDPTLEPGLAPGGLAMTADAAPGKHPSSTIEPAQQKLLDTLRRAIANGAQPAFSSIDPDSLNFEDGQLVVRTSAEQVPDAFVLCDSVFASSGGFGMLTATRIYVDGRLAAEAVIGADGGGDCSVR